MLRNLAAAAPSPRPQFVLTHITLPHPPYVFDEDGSERRPSVPGDDRRAAFEAQLAYFNDQLLEIIDIAQGRAEPPIIVLLADEGVYPEDVAPLDRPDYDPRDLSPSELRQKMSITAAVFDPEGEVALEGTRVTPLSVLDQVLRRVLDIGVDDADAPIFYWAPSGSEEPFVDVTRELVEGSDG